MPLTRNQKIGIGVGVGIGLFALAGSAKAKVPDVVIPAEPVDPNAPNPLDDIPDQPLPPPPPQCNYSGCGQPFDGNHQSPTFYATRLQQLGYPISVQTVAANNSTIAVQPQRGYFALFQGHFNSIRQHADGFPPAIAAKLIKIKNSPKLSVDGLNGNKTINALSLAHEAVGLTNISWENLVRIVEGSG